jgi:hypothetical protein
VRVRRYDDDGIVLSTVSIVLYQGALPSQGSIVTDCLIRKHQLEAAETLLFGIADGLNMFCTVAKIAGFVML